MVYLSPGPAGLAIDRPFFLSLINTVNGINRYGPPGRVGDKIDTKNQALKYIAALFIINYNSFLLLIVFITFNFQSILYYLHFQSYNILYFLHFQSYDILYSYYLQSYEFVIIINN